MKWHLLSDRYPPHKDDLLLKVQDPNDQSEVYITGGWYDADTNNFEPYGFERSYFEVLAWAIVPEQWIERDGLPEIKI